MVAAGTVSQEKASSDNSDVAEPRQRRFLVSKKKYFSIRQIIGNFDFRVC